ncbi:response regulator transcription factor [Ciceribacter sp. L1K22]|uniref:response regulator transcription factor n=1 Tax=Ciceribacter sp. L1K22 TaxID=2820275 RepID=UPI001ABE1F61|nr:response regulator transcription factor [Ciceribacter sp. L1K22]MBO3758403.1 response regulator transcription factor [Ciceribacter sp. L1K22]
MNKGTVRDRIQVLVVEDDAPVRWRVCDALRGAEEFAVEEAANLEEARQFLSANPVRVLLSDLRLPDGSGIDLIRAVRQKYPEAEIMVISILGDEESVIAAITAGANGYLLKDAFPADVVETVRDLVAGHSPISASIARFIVRHSQGAGRSQATTALNTAKLTPREIDILWGIAKGFSYSDIADHLGISRQTVPGHIKNIYRKLEVNTRGEAVFEAVQQGLIKL